MKKYLLLFLMCVYASIGAWATEVSYPFTFGDGNLSKVEKVDFGNNQYGLVVTIGKTGDFAIFANMLGNSGDSYISSNYLNYGRLRIVCTNGAVINATDVATYESKMSNAPLTCLDLTDAAFDADATITSFIANGVAYVALPQGKDISDVTLKDDGTIKGVVTSNGSSAIYTAYNGAADANFNTLFIGSSLQNIGTWTITNGVASGSHITAGAETGNILTAIVSNSTATTLNITLDGITNSPTTLAPSSSITNLTISGIQYPNQYESLTINGGSALTTLTLEDTTIPGSLTIGGCPELVTADLRGVRKKPNGGSTKLDVTVNDDPKLSNLILYKSSTETGCNVSGTTRPVGSGLTVTYALPAIPIEYDDCEVTINLAARGTKTMSQLITEAETELAKSNTNICTLIVTGELTTTDLQSLDDANTATRIDLSETTLATGAAITSLQVPSSIKSLVLPKDMTVTSTLADVLDDYTNLDYAYSPSSDSQRPGVDQEDSFNNSKNTIADYVWVNQSGGLKQAFINEETLRNSYYIKVASEAALNTYDVDFNALGDNKPSNYLFLDFSASNLTPEMATNYKVTDWIGYRVILPDGWTDDEMAVFAALPYGDRGNLAAVYSYSSTGETLNVLEITDATYNTAALNNDRIVREGTTTLNIVTGTHNGTWGEFGSNLLAAINNAKSSITTVNITTANCPATLTFDNDNIRTLSINGVTNAMADLDVTGCAALQTLNVTTTSLKSIYASDISTLTSVNLTNTAISGATNLSSDNLATLTTSRVTSFGGNVDLTGTSLTSFTTEARITGNIDLTGSASLANVDVSNANFQNTTSTITVESSSDSGVYIAALKHDNDGKDGVDKSIKVPTGFDTDRIIPHGNDAVEYVSEGTGETKISDLIEEKQITALPIEYGSSLMYLHEKESGDNFLYWYQGTQKTNDVATITTTSAAERKLTALLNNGDAEGKLNTNTQFTKVKIVGPLDATDVAALDGIQATVLDLSEAEVDSVTLKNQFKTNALNSATKFLILPNGSTRQALLNATNLAGLSSNLYCAIATEETVEGLDLTSYSFVSGALQPAVVTIGSTAGNPAGISSCASWTAKPDGTTGISIFTSDISNFKALKISGLINAYDLSKNAQVVDANGHIYRTDTYEEVSKNFSATWLGGDNTVSGPFSACFNITEIDLRDAYFEPVNDDPVTEWKRYYFQDMTLAALNIVGTSTRKIVIPEDSRVKEVPADFLNSAATNIRAICIPSNIRAIRTRAFYTIDYVWATAHANDPEGDNTRLDNGAVYASGETIYATEDPDFSYTDVPTGGTYTFGSNIKVIETAAFANTQPHVSDVYVLNTIAPECHVDAFNTVMYVGNGGYSPVITDGIITRNSYQNNGFWITMLHYPRQTTDPQIQRYTDPTREYSIATGERDGKGAIIYFPNQSEFNRAYNQGTYGYTWNGWDPTRLVNNSVADGGLNVTQPWSKEGQATANDLYTNNPLNKDTKKFYSFYDVSLGGNTKPAGLVDYYKVNWNPSEYQYSEVDRNDGLAGNLYPKSEKVAGSDIDGSGEETSKDYRGWHQFVLNAYAANTILEEEPYRSYITDNEWWTIVPEFDITRSEAAILFGKSPVIDKNLDKPSYPYVSKLKYVRRNYADESINLCFTGNLTTLHETRDGDNKHGNTDDYGVMNPAGDYNWNADDVVMKSGVPYLIKPAFDPGAFRQFRIFKTEKDLGEYQAANPESNVIAFYHENLYKKLHDSQIVSGNDQMADVKAGVYIVPAFASEANKDGITKESVVEGTEHKIGDIQYYVSADWCYAFVGTFYKSFLPHFSYFLGWDSSKNCAKFYYHNGNFEKIDKEMRWANGTGVIVPIKKSALKDGAFPYSVTPAQGKDPAQWKLQTAFDDDSYVSSSSGALSVKAYNMIFDAPDITPSDSDVTGISNVETEDSNILDNVNVYSVNGQKVGTSLEGLPKGIYIVNGKKYIVK